MNLIQLSEQLKEAPDNLLMQEVRAPTGSYPSYLIISELTRRKRLREGAQPQQTPQTTVADDLSQPAGLAATPQAMQSTAGMDVNGQGDYEEQDMPEMAGGGLVAFAQGDLIRRQAESDSYVDQSGFQMSRPNAARGNAAGYHSMLPGGMADLERASRALSPEEREGIRALEMERFQKLVPSRREEEGQRLAAKERAIEGERESNVNMALMEAGLGMMGSRAPRGMQGIAEGGLRGLSSFKAGKQDIKKSEAYLDQARENYARAQELYDQKKYAAGDKALQRADQQQAFAISAAQAKIQGIKAGIDIERGEEMHPLQMEKAQRDLQFARDTYESRLAEARLLPKSREAQIAKDLAAAHLANTEAAAGGKRRGASGTGFASGAELKSAQEATKELLMSPQPIPGLKGEEPLLPGSKAYQAAYQKLLPMIVFQGKGNQMFMSIPGQQESQPGVPGVIRFDESGQRVQ